MGQVSKTIWYMLTNSIVTSIVILILGIFILFAQIAGLSTEELSNDKVIMMSLSLNGTLSFLIGIYIGGGLLKIKQIYLWSTNSYFRHTILASFFIVIAAISLLQAVVMAINIEGFLLLIFAPFCIAVFIAQAILLENYLLKFIIPSIPFLLAQLRYFGLDYNLIMVVVLAATVLLIYKMYNSGMYRKTSVKQALELVSVSEKQHVNPLVIKLNYLVGYLFSNKITKAKNDISWAISLPLTKMGIMVIFPVLLVTLSIFIIEGNLPLLEPYALMIMSTLIISILMESRMLLSQTRAFAHVFGGKNNCVTKQKIINSTDKNIIVNCTYFIVAVIFLGWLLGLLANLQFLALAGVSIIIIGLAFYPMLLRLVWVTVSWQLVAGVCAFGAIVFIVCRWLNDHLETGILSIEFPLFIMAMLIVRAFSKYLFINTPFESLLKNK